MVISISHQFYMGAAGDPHVLHNMKEPNESNVIKSIFRLFLFNIRGVKREQSFCHYLNGLSQSWRKNAAVVK